MASVASQRHMPLGVHSSGTIATPPTSCRQPPSGPAPSPHSPRSLSAQVNPLGMAIPPPQGPPPSRAPPPIPCTANIQAAFLATDATDATDDSLSPSLSMGAAAPFPVPVTSSTRSSSPSSSNNSHATPLPTPTANTLPVTTASLKPVYRSMLDIGPSQPKAHKDTKDSYSSGSVTPSRSSSSSAEISREQSAEINNGGQFSFGTFSLSPVQTNSTTSNYYNNNNYSNDGWNMDEAQGSEVGSEPVANKPPPVHPSNELARATTSPSLLTMASPARAQRSTPAPLFRNTSSIYSTAKRLPDLPPPSPAPAPASAHSHSHSHAPPAPAASSSKAIEKDQVQKEQPHGFFKRVESFISKKNRNSYITPASDRLPDSAPPTSQRQHPKGAAFSLSSQSPMDSPAGTPPSPRSRESTVADYEVDPTTASGAGTDTFGQSGHGHSASATNMGDMTEQPRAVTPRGGITWGPNFTEDGSSLTPYTQRPRRRSISQDNLSFGKKRGGDPDAPVELMATFSFRSAEGVGMKSRRLSTSLPDEFHVDSCELHSEFTAAGSNPFVRGKTVGKGATAVVKLMHRKGDSKKLLYAAKEFRRKDKAEDELEYVKKVKSEFTIANSAHHPNIVRTVRLCENHGRWNHVMEYCSYGELYHWVEKGVFRRGQWSVTDRQCLFKQLIRGVDYLHAHGIAHRDLKLENLLLNQEGRLKITDFGVSDVFSGEHPGLRTSGGQCGKNMGTIRRSTVGICGSLPYIAPEVLEKKGDYDPRAYDVWSCAIVYMVMIHGGNPWNEARIVDRGYRVFKSAWDEWLETHPDAQIKDEENGAPKAKECFLSKFFPSPGMRRLILQMLHLNPDQRPTITEVLNSVQIRAIDVCSPEACDEDGNDIDPSLQEDCTNSKVFKKAVVRKKHSHIPPKEHKTPTFFQHRFDMGDGYR